MAAGNLETAAEQSLGTMWTRYVAGTLKTNLTAFATALTVTTNVFPDDDPTLRPVGDWFILLQSLTNNMTGASPPVLTDVQRANAVIVMIFRILWQCVQLIDVGLLAPAKGVLVLAAWNANLS